MIMGSLVRRLVRSMRLKACLYLILAACGGSIAQAQDIIPPKSYTTTPGGINVADQSLVYSVTDLSVGTLTLERSHRTGNPQSNDHMFGWNFASNFEIYLAKIPIFDVSSSGQVVTEHRLIAHLGSSASGTYVVGANLVDPNPNNGDAEKGILAWDSVNSKYVYTDSSGTIYTFHATITPAGVTWQSISRVIERIDFPNGMVRTFSYDGNGRLRLVEDSTGYAMLFDYNGNGDVSAACGFVRAQTYVDTNSSCSGAALKTTYSYTYDATHQLYLLTSAVDVLGKTTSYTNAFEGITCITPPTYSSCKMAITAGNYGNGLPAAQFHSITQTLLDGGAWHIEGEDQDVILKGSDDSAATDDGLNIVTVTDPDNVSMILTFTKTSPYTMTDANGDTTYFKFEGGAMFNYTGPVTHDGTMLIEATYPEGDKYQAVYQGPFRAVTTETYVAKPGPNQPPPLVKTYTYGSCTTGGGTYQNCAKPIAITDPKGNTSNFTYASHGGVLTEWAPAAVLGSPGSTVTARPLKVTTWAQRYAMIKNSGGTLVQASAPIWVIATETQCQSAVGAQAPTCDGTKPQTVTTYEYGLSSSGEALLVKGVAVAADGTTLRSCSTYDPWHRKLSETTPNGVSGSSCP